MSYTYATFVTTLANLMGEDPTDSNWLQYVPSMIDYAEGRIYRELDLLASVIADRTASLSTGTRNFTLPSTLGRFQTVDAINVFTPVSTLTLRNPLTEVSVDALNWMWPSDQAVTGYPVPVNFAWLQDGNAGLQTVLVGPAPSATYNVEVIGTIIPVALSSTNTTSFLASYLPDLFLAASMIQGSAYQKNFGAEQDNPQQAMSWEQQYQALFKSADMVESRKKFSSVSWTSKKPEPNVSPQRG